MPNNEQEIFFISTPLGFETETREEILECWHFLLDKTAKAHALSLPEMTMIKGGLELETTLLAAVQLNFFLKTANRILWRLDSFEVKDFQKLFTKIQKSRYSKLFQQKVLNIKVAASQSQLGQEKKIEEIIRKALGAKPDEASTESLLYVRIEKNICTLSVNVTGEHLHKRSVLHHRGEAPLRETIAAFCLRKMLLNTSRSELKKISLVDPMCGSGSFLFEAHSLYLGSFNRNYAFQNWNMIPKLFRLPGFEKNYKVSDDLIYKKYFGFDKDEKMVLAAQHNLRNYFIKEMKDENHSHDDFKNLIPIQFLRADLFQPVAKFSETPCWLIVNPPYGERLEIQKPQLYLDAFLKFGCQKIGILWPQQIWNQINIPTNLKLVLEQNLSNGGLPIAFRVYELQSMTP